MNRDLSDQYRADPAVFGSDSASPDGLEAEAEEEEYEEPQTETLMEALSRFITIDEEAQTVYGCESDFRHTENILAAHGQEESTAEVIALMNKQGAFCDCEVLLNSRMDIVFIESDAEYFDEEEEQEE